MGRVLGWTPTRELSVAWRYLRRAALNIERRVVFQLHQTHELTDERIHQLVEQLEREEARFWR